MQTQNERSFDELSYEELMAHGERVLRAIPQSQPLFPKSYEESEKLLQSITSVGPGAEGKFPALHALVKSNIERMNPNAPTTP